MKGEYVAYTCEKCNFSTKDKTKFTRHNLSKRHKRGNIKVNYNCKCCDFNTINKSVFITHTRTKKHIKNYASERLNELYNIMVDDTERISL